MASPVETQSVNDLGDHFRSPRRALAALLALACTGYYMYVAVVGTFAPQLDRSLFIFFGIALAVLLRPLGKGPLPAIVDGAILLAVGFATWRFNDNYLAFARSAGFPIGDFDMAMGWIMILGSLEAARRALGAVMALIGAAFLAFLYFGPFMPDPLRHAGFDFRTIATAMYGGTSGLYGGITYILASNMFLFLVFGAFLIRAGASDFFNDIALALFGRHAGGSAKAAVGSSALTASINGSAASNVAITGSLTIPLMIRQGYRPPVAGGIEAAASTGGTIMPPVMGASAFIMVAITGIPYSVVALHALVPALLFFVIVFMQVHFYARRQGLAGLPAAACPPVWPTLQRGWPFILPLLAILVLIFMDYSLRRIGLLAIVTLVVATWLTRSRMGPRAILLAMIEGAQGALSILAVAGVVSIIAGAILLPGTGLRITGLIIGLADASLALTMLAVFVIAYVLGMGLSVLPAYVILATLAAPALIQLGIDPLAAHLLVLWWGQTSNVTPPVALAAYMAAGIARASTWSTGNAAVLKAAGLFFLPVLFVYQPGLLLNGGPLQIALTLSSILCGSILLAAAIEGFFFSRLGVLARLLLAAGGIVLVFADGLAALPALLGFTALVWALGRRVGRTELPAAATVEATLPPPTSRERKP
ncbi:MAG: TRAP transporter fused permease subunit [Geminicoccaceae bacterium]|nr:MAG: TRAP transporter fused permease subunit [Geminicoccaceae bacterium]